PPTPHTCTLPLHDALPICLQIQHPADLLRCGRRIFARLVAGNTDISVILTTHGDGLILDGIVGLLQRGAYLFRVTEDTDLHRIGARLGWSGLLHRGSGGGWRRLLRR